MMVRILCSIVRVGTVGRPRTWNSRRPGESKVTEVRRVEIRLEIC
jgi:hypothetical protein